MVEGSPRLPPEQPSQLFNPLGSLEILFNSLGEPLLKSILPTAHGWHTGQLIDHANIIFRIPFYLVYLILIFMPMCSDL